MAPTRESGTLRPQESSHLMKWSVQVADEQRSLMARHLVRRNEVGRGLAFTISAIFGFVIIGLLIYALWRTEKLPGKKKKEKKDKKKKEEAGKCKHCKKNKNSRCTKSHCKKTCCGSHDHHHHGHGTTGDGAAGHIRIRTGRAAHGHHGRHHHRHHHHHHGRHHHRHHGAVQPYQQQQQQPYFPFPFPGLLGPWHRHHHGQRGMYPGKRRCHTHHHVRRGQGGNNRPQYQQDGGFVDLGGGGGWGDGDGGGVPPGTTPFVPIMRPARHREHEVAMKVADEMGSPSQDAAGLVGRRGEDDHGCGLGRSSNTDPRKGGLEQMGLEEEECHDSAIMPHVDDGDVLLHAKAITRRKPVARRSVLEAIAMAVCCGRR